jgi:molybdopterin adenylyltransferase
MKSGIKILSVNISEKKGTIKLPVEHIMLDVFGVVKDAHRGPWQRQVSMLGKESIDRFAGKMGRKINFGEFAENITTEGMNLFESRPLDRFVTGSAELEVTQIGKKCHGDNCAIFREVGDCVMPVEGIFCRVIKPGKISPGMEMNYFPKIFKALVLTLSDRASRGEYQDLSGPRTMQLAKEYFQKMNWQHDIQNNIFPDNRELLETALKDAISGGTDLVFTTGGTGIGPRDITPEAVRSVIDKEIPGIMEMIRYKYGQDKPNALLSRGIAGVAGKTLIYSMPGSVRAVNEYMQEILRTIEHSIFMLHGLDSH